MIYSSDYPVSNLLFAAIDVAEKCNLLFDFLYWAVQRLRDEDAKLLLQARDSWLFLPSVETAENLLYWYVNYFGT